jgi:hypothetical protein
MTEPPYSRFARAYAADWVVSVGTADARLANAYGATQGRPTLTLDDPADLALDQLLTHADSVFVIGAELGLRDVTSIVNRAFTATRAGDGLRVGCPVGFLQAPPAGLERLLHRLIEVPAGNRSKDVIIDATTSSTVVNPVDELCVLDYRKVSASTLRAVGPIRLLAVTGHGEGHLFYLGDDFICGRVRQPTGVPGGLGYLPSCMQQDAICVQKPRGVRLPAYELDADHLFVNACGTARFESGEFGPDFGLWNAAMEGRARSYVGSLRWKDGHGLEGLLYRHLLHVGVPLGQAVAIVNAVLPYHHLEREPVLCLLGDPAERVVERADDALDLKRTPSIGNGDQLAWEDGFAVARVSDPDLIAAWQEEALLVGGHGDGQPYFSVVPTSGKEPLLLAYAASSDTKTVRMRLLDDRPLRERLAQVRHVAATSLNSAIGIVGMYPDAVRQGGRLNVENRILNLARLRRRLKTDGRALGKLLQGHDKLEREVDALDSQTAEQLLRHICVAVYRYSEHYQDSFALTAVEPAGTCPDCGLRTVRRVQHSLVDSAVSRAETLCPLCGTLGDVPDDHVLLALEAPAAVYREQHFTPALSITNQATLPMTGYAVMGVRRAEQYGASGPEMPTRVQIQAGTTGVVSFDFSFAVTTAAHQYDLQSGFVSTGQIYMARRPIGVIEAHA